MPSVIYVPTINIHDDTWLINNFSSGRGFIVLSPQELHQKTLLWNVP
jgi:hypothetical protein